VAEEDTSEQPGRGDTPRRRKADAARNVDMGAAASEHRGGDDGGGIGVREPRRPKPGGDVEVEPEEIDE